MKQEEKEKWQRRIDRAVWIRREVAQIMHRLDELHNELNWIINEISIFFIKNGVEELQKGEKENGGKK